MVGLTGLSATIAFVLGIIAWHQFRSQAHTNTENLRIAKTAADAAKNSADGLMRSERAYVGFLTWPSVSQEEQNPPVIGFRPWEWKGTTHFVEGTRMYRIEVRLVNSGRTPAQISGGMIRCVTSEPDPRVFDSPIEAQEREVIDGNYLAPSGEYMQKITLGLTTEQEAAINDDRLWLVGCLNYADVFNAQHRLLFARRVMKGGNPRKNNLFADHTTVDHNCDYEVDEQGNRKT